MSSPEVCGQPAYTGDPYYRARAFRPNEANAWGGFQTDSSLLGLVAYRLYENGMTLEQCKGYWTTVLSAMNPGTTDLQLTVLLPWALNRAGLTDFMAVLYEAMDEVMLGYEYWQPLQPAEGTALITMFLPEGSMLNLEEPVITLSDTDGQKLSFSGLVDATGTMSFLALPGSYAVSLTVLDNLQSRMVTWSYDGQQWTQTDTASPAASAPVLTLAAGETCELQTAGLT